MQQQEMKKVIDRYIEAYNSFDIAGMLSIMHNDIVFRNISNGRENMVTHGLKEFHQAAEKACSLFSDRQQTILEYSFGDEQANIKVDYSATLANDFSASLKAGDVLMLKGHSEFEFRDGRIISLTDYC